MLYCRAAHNAGSPTLAQNILVTVPGMVLNIHDVLYTIELVLVLTVSFSATYPALIEHDIARLSLWCVCICGKTTYCTLS